MLLVAVVVTLMNRQLHFIGHIYEYLDIEGSGVLLVLFSGNLFLLRN